MNPKFQIFRLILDPPRAATLNMAIDEMLMESQALPNTIPILRFYSWLSPACSIGYFQNIDKIAKRFQSIKTGIPIVRRITGGGLVLHGQDLTFSITVKGDNPFFLGPVKDSYLKVNEALRVGLKQLFFKIDYADCKNIPSGRSGKDTVCFETPSCYDLLLDGEKIVGASQRRKSGTILHQSSIFLDGDQKNLFRYIIEGFKENWKINYFEEPLSEEELLTAQQKEKERYTSEHWAYVPNNTLIKI